MKDLRPNEWRAVFRSLEGAHRSAWRAVYRVYLRSDAWADIRKAMLEHADGYCNNCGKQRKLQVHHKTYRNVGDEEYRDLTALCSWCHMLKHGIIQHTRWYTDLMDRLFGPAPTRPKPWKERQSDELIPGEGQ